MPNCRVQRTRSRARTFLHAFAGAPLTRVVMRSTSKALLYFLSLGVAVYAAIGYGVMPLGSLVHPDMQADFVAHPLGVYLHVFAAAVALLLGPFQFSARLRRARIHLHRWMGRVYLSVGVLIGGLSGLYISQFAFGGLVAKLGFRRSRCVGCIPDCGRSSPFVTGRSMSTRNGWYGTSRLRLLP